MPNEPRHGTSFLARTRPILKLILAKIGLYDVRAKKLKLKRVRHNDIFVVSYPKSGNTWVRFLIANMRNPERENSFRNIQEIVPDIHKSRAIIDASKPPRYIKSHHPFYSCYPKFIYIYRDVRDVFVSYYHYQTQNDLFTGNFHEFLQAVAFNSNSFFGTWHEHVENALDYAAIHPKKVLLVCYEHMLVAPLEDATRIAKFCGLQSNRPFLEEVVQKCKFESLQKMEEKYGSEDDHTKAKFFRSGKQGQWSTWYSDENMEMLLQLNGNTLRRLQYID